MRDLRNAPAEALLSVDEICAPDGPGPWRRTRFLKAVAEGEAPAPVMKLRKCVRWRWGDVLAWLDSLAEGA